MILFSELVIKVVNTADSYKVLYLRELPKPTKHLSFDPSGTYIAASCTDGIVYIYSLSTEEPELIRKVDGLIRRLEVESDLSARAVWHPDGRAFAAPTATRDVQVVSSGDGERQRAFSGGHMGDVTALAWSPNGALLITAGKDHKIVLWDTKTQKTLSRYDFPNVINMVWHPTSNLVSFVTSDGELFIHTNFLQSDFKSHLDRPIQPAPFIRDPLVETNGNARRPLTNGLKGAADPRERRRGTPDSLDDLLGPELGDEDDFVSDDDGAGYADEVNGYGKRSSGHLEVIDGFDNKRRAIHQSWQPRLHQSFQPGSTPWRGNRKYLCKLKHLPRKRRLMIRRPESYGICLDRRPGHSSHGNCRIL